MRRIGFLIAFFACLITFGQVDDDFTDGDFTASPAWSGSSSFGVSNPFEIVEADNQLRSQNLDMGSGTRIMYLSTSDVLDLSSSTAEWSFRFRLAFSQPGSASTNSNNTSRVYLMSDVADLSGDVDGYYVELRYPDSDINEVRLFRQDGSSTSEVALSGTVQSLTSEAFASVVVTRSEVGLWEVEVNSTSQGTATDNTYSTSSNFGVQVRYTANSRDNGFFFDDFSSTITPVADTDPPTIQSITAISDTEVDVLFSETVDQTTAETSGNYAIDQSISVTNASRDGSNDALVHLTVSALANGTTYNVTINNVEDESSNVIATDSQDSFEYLVFEEAVQFDVVINEFMPDPNPVVALPDAEFVELYNRSSKYFNLENWTLDGQTLPAYTLAPDSYVIIVEDDDLVEFGAFSEVLDITTLSLSNTALDNIVLQDDNATTIHSVSFEGSTGGISTELINPNGPDYSSQNFGLSTDPDGGTPGEQNAIFDDTPDTTPASVTSITVISATEIDVYFSEFVEESSAESSGNYGIDGGITVSAAALDDTNFTLVHLTVSALVSGDTRTLTVNGVEDYSGNASVDATGDFQYIEIEEAAEFDVVINEFLAAPDAESGIPDAEYVELYNRSDKYLNLENWTLDGQSLSSYVFAPDSYVLVVEDDDFAAFGAYTEVLQVTTLTLSNSGSDNIVLVDDNAVTIHSIAFQGSTDGVSEELINPDGPDYSSQNFGLSTDPDGGTPGEQNALFNDTPDTTPASVSSITVVSATEIDVYFSEFVEESSAETSGNYGIDGGITVSAAALDDTNFTLVHLTVSALVSGDIRTLTVNGVEDYSGNASMDATGQFEYIETETASAGDVVINEFHPLPSSESGIPNVEYVELYNLSSKFIDLDGWTMQDAVSTSSSFDSYIIRPGEFIILTESGNGSLFAGFGDVLEVGNFVSLNNSGDQIVIRNAASDTLSEVSYTSSTSGIAWELINPNGPDYSINNFGLSTDPDGGTPGEQNSIFDDTPDTTQPTITSASHISATEVDISFDEPIEEVTAETIGNYTIDNGVTVSAAIRDESDNSLVHLTVSTLTNGESYTITVNNLEDLSGNVIVADSQTNFQYLVFDEADQFDVVINEFMPDPNPVVGLPDAEFVELYNRSSKYFNLQNWTLDGQLLPTYTLAPDSYVIVVEDDDAAAYSAYPEVISVTTLTLNNTTTDNITLIDDNDLTVHSNSFEGGSEGISTELINPNGPDYSVNKYGFSIDPDGGTPGTQNSIFDDTPDTTPPNIVSRTVISSTELEIVFNELLEETSAETLGNYAIDGDISVTAAMLDDADHTLVHLTVSALVSAEVRTLTVNGVQDLSGNPTVDETIDFEYIETEAAVAGDIVINEFLALPSDASAIPNAEFIELYNVSSKFIDLADWTIQDNTSTSNVFESAIVRPGEYLILTETGNGGLFETSGDVLEVGGFVSLNNSGDGIFIRNSSMDTIANVSYTSSTSGVSWEMINPNGPDYSFTNYGLSTDPEGGTPGSQNSIFDDTPDTTAPIIESIEVISNTVLDIYFDEQLEETSAETIGNYSIDGGISVTAAMLDDADHTLVHLTVSALVSAEVRTLTVNGVQDLSGNPTVAEAIDFEYIETEAAVVGDIVINEFLTLPSDASGIPNAEFIELYNVSSKFIDLADWTIQDNTSTSNVFESAIVRPGEYLILTETGNGSLFETYGDVLEVGGFVSLNNSGDGIFIRNSSMDTIANVSYTSSTAGVSWEMINPNGPDYSFNNYGLSTDPDGGTPGSQNSIFDDTPDTTPPSIVSRTVISSTELEVVFNELLEETSAETLGNYSIDGGISVTAAMLDDADHTLVHLTVSALVSAEVRTLTVNGVQDLSGNPTVAETIDFEYIETEAAVTGDIVINEFLALPSDASGIPNAEFIELYNVSSKFIDLADWTIQDNTSTSNVFESAIVRPGEYLILTETGNGSLFETYGDVLEVGGFVSLNNSGDGIFIRNSSMDTIANVSYTSSTAGVSWEMINPNGPDYSFTNYGLSTDPDGGTPGAQNAIFDDTPDTTAPIIESIEVISNTALDIYFDEQLEETSAETIDNYSIDGGISVTAAMLDDEDHTLVHLTVSALVSAEVRTLTVNGVQDLSGNPTVAEAIDFEYIETEAAVVGDIVINEFLALPSDASGIPNAEFIELYNNSSKYLDLAGWRLFDATSNSSAFNSAILRPGGYIILTETGNGSLFETYGDVLEVGGFVSLNNSGDDIVIQNNLNATIAEISYSGSQSGISLELINPNDPCLSILSYGASVSAEGGTPGSQNSIFNDTPDTTPPTISSYGFGSTLTINFSEVMDAESLLNGNYIIADQLIDEVRVGAEFPTSVELTFVESLTPGIIYELTVNGLLDCAGNEIDETTLTFSIGQTPSFNEIIITEIMFDADPAVGLPEREFIEIYNTTSKVLTSEGVQLTDATSTVDLPVFNLDPNSYYVLSTTAGAPEFADAIGVSGFPSLNNSGEQLILSVGDELIFSVTYDPGWHDENKSDGGYALEMIDVTNPCVEDNNWGSSTNPNGGTPGSSNSLSGSIVDNFGPEVMDVTAITVDTIRVRFNEKLSHLVETEATAEIQPSILVEDFYFDINQPQTLFIILAQELEESIQYTLSLQDVFDCSRNEIQESDFSFALPAIAETGDIKLSEVLFNPRSNGVDFVEIYNDSDQYLSLKNWQLARITEEGIDDQKVISEDELVIDPNSYLVFTTDADVLLTNYPKGQFDRFIEVASLPTYANDTGNVVLLNDLEVVQERFHYDQDYHYDLLESVDGVSLERVSFDSPTDDANNWRSASSTEGFATPGYANSQSFSQAAPVGRVSVDPKVFIPGNAGSGRDFTTINYQMDNAGQFANVNIYDQTGRLVKNLAQGELLSTSGFLRWDGVTDKGGMARMGYYVVVFEIYDAAGNTDTIKQTVVVGRDF